MAIALANSGIAVYDDDGATMFKTPSEPLSGLRFLRSQARGMALEISAGSGFKGADLNDVTPPLPLPDGRSLLMSQLLFAYVTTATTPGAVYSRFLLGDVSGKLHDQVVYPSAVIALFLQEVAIPLLGDAQKNGIATSDTGSVTPTAFSGADPVAELSVFLDDVPGAVSAAAGTTTAQSPRYGGKISMALSWDSFISAAKLVVGVAASIAETAVQEAIRNTPFVQQLAKGAAILAAIADVKSLLTQWDVSVAASGGMHKVPGAPTSGIYTLTVSNGSDQFTWPAYMTSVANYLAIPLPDLNGNNGLTVTWTEVAGFGSLGVKAGEENVTSAGKATLNVNSTIESAEIHANGTLSSGPLSVIAEVEQPGLQNVVDNLIKVINPTSMLGSIAAGAAKAGAELIVLSAPGSMVVTYHEGMVDGNTGMYHIKAAACGGANAGVWKGQAQLIIDPCPDGNSVPVQWDFAGGNTATIPAITVDKGCVGITYTQSGTVTNLGDSLSFDLSTTVIGHLDEIITVSDTIISTMPIISGGSDLCQ